VTAYLILIFDYDMIIWYNNGHHSIYNLRTGTVETNKKVRNVYLRITYTGWYRLGILEHL